MDNLEVCRKTREIAAQSLHSALDVSLQGTDVSEADLRNLWVDELRKNKNIFENGWYMPPENGVGVIFATDSDSGRLNYGTLRKMEAEDTVMMDTKKGIVYVYASPVDRRTGIIGDFGMTIYFGKNQKIINHLLNCREINNSIFSAMKTGMPFSEIHSRAVDIIERRGLFNDVVTTTDPGSSNVMGHTIPAIHDSWDGNEIKIFESGTWGKIKDVISRKRKFISSTENTTISPPMAVTIEPRVRSAQLPIVSYHTISVFRENSQKEMLENFDDIFSLTGMDYMLGEQK